MDDLKHRGRGEPIDAAGGTSDPAGHSHHSFIRRRRPLHIKILLGLAVGAVAGIAANEWGQFAIADAPAHLDLDGNGIHDRVDWLANNLADPLGRVFLRLMFMVVVPLVFSALVVGVYGLGDVRRLGRVGLRTLGYTLVLSMLAVGLGVTLVNWVQPGAALSSEQRELLKTQYAGKASETVQRAKAAKSLKDTLLDIIPENPLQEMVGALDGSSKGNGMLAVMFFALMFGVALTLVPSPRAGPVVGVLEGVFDVCMVIIGWAMRLAPIAVALLVFSITSRLGISVLQILVGFVLTVLAALAIHLVVVYSTFVRVWGGMKPMQFYRASAEAMLTAFGTSSSNATLPTSMRVAHENLKLPRSIADFVLTVGATGNQNGTALYEGMVVLFLAQVFGVDLSLPQQITVVLMSVLAGVGTAGVPGGSLPVIVLVMQSVGIPGEGIAIILGVDRILDMCRTVLNVTGDLAIATVVARKDVEAKVATGNR